MKTKYDQVKFVELVIAFFELFSAMLEAPDLLQYFVSYAWSGE